MHLFDFFIARSGIHAFPRLILPPHSRCRHVLGWEVERMLKAIGVTLFIAHSIILGAVSLEAVDFLLGLTESSL
jgi:hypothetical protein